MVSAAVFGPYVLGGFRTEQLAIYLSLGGVLVSARHLRPQPMFLNFAILWGAVLGIALTSAAFPVQTTFEAGELLPGLDNLVLPLATVAITAIWSSGGDERRREALDLASSVLCYGLCLNTVVTIASIYIEFPWLELFWSSTNEESVATRAAQLGRVSGIFNQPAESGMAYSIGLALAMWRWSWRQNRSRKLLIVATLLVVGGMLSVSKIFLLGGLPVFAVLLFAEQRGRGRRLIIGVPVSLTLIGGLTSGVIPWSGSDRLREFFEGGRPNQSALTYFSAGRYGARSTLEVVARITLDEAPWFGYGAQGIDVAYDSSWVEMLVIGGLVALICFLVLVFLLALGAWTMNRQTFPLERRLSLALIAIFALSSFGAPAATANRSATLLWLVLGLSLIHCPRSLHARQQVGTAHDPLVSMNRSAAWRVGTTKWTRMSQRIGAKKSSLVSLL